MATKAELAELIARVGAATGPDAELNTDIAETLGERRPGLLWQAEHYTASLDVALATVERVLPVYALDATIRRDPSVHFAAKIDSWPSGLSSHVQGFGVGPTLPLAICLALLRALHAQAPE